MAKTIKYDGAFHFKLDKKLKNEFKELCEEMGYTESKIIRRMMRDFIKSHKDKEDE